MQKPLLLAVVLSSLLACRMFDKDKSKPGALASAAAVNSAAPAPGSASAAFAKSPDKPLEWEAGQWTRHRVKFGKNESVMTYKVLKHAGDDYLLEMVSKAGPQGDTVMQIEMAMKGVMNAKDAQIKAARLKFPGGKVQEFNGKLLGPVQTMYKNVLGAVVIPKIGSLQRQDVTVAAGSFAGCFRNETTTDIMGSKTAGTTFAHFSVPISATVKVEGKDGSTQMELLAFGLSGAKSEL